MSIERVIDEGVIDYDFLKREGFKQDTEELFWHNNSLQIEYDYFSEWMWFGKEGIPRVDSQKRFIELLDSNGAKEKLKELNRKYTLQK